MSLHPELLLLISAAAIGIVGLVRIMIAPKSPMPSADAGQAAVASKAEPGRETVATAIEAEKAPSSYAFVDLETTGLDPENDRIIEIAVVIFTVGASLHDAQATLVNPSRLLTPFITDYTGITDEMLATAPSSAILHDYFDLIGDRTVFAYNAEFDMGFLKAAAQRLSRPFANPSRCIMEMARERHPDLRSYKLTDVCEAFDVSVEGSAHRAMADAERALKVWAAIFSSKQPNESAVRKRDRSTDWGVYGHYSEDGLLFYVWNAKNGGPTTPKDDYLWKHYVETHLAGKYEIRRLKEGLTLDKAIAIQTSLLAEHADTALNRANFFRGVEQEHLSQHDKLRKSCNYHRKKAKALEVIDPEAAIKHYQKALEMIGEFTSLILEHGLYGKLCQELDVQSHGYDAIMILDRISLLLCSLGRPVDAQEIAEACFERYRKAALSTEAGAIRHRITMALARKNT